MASALPTVTAVSLSLYGKLTVNGISLTHSYSRVTVTVGHTYSQLHQPYPQLQPCHYYCRTHLQSMASALPTVTAVSLLLYGKLKECQRQESESQFEMLRQIYRDASTGHDPQQQIQGVILNISLIQGNYNPFIPTMDDKCWQIHVLREKRISDFPLLFWV